MVAGKKAIMKNPFWLAWSSAPTPQLVLPVFASARQIATTRSNPIRIPRMAAYSSPARSAIGGARRVRGMGVLFVTAGLSLAAAGTPLGHYVQTNLVSNVPGLAAATDPNLVNPWGLTRSAASPWWAADNGAGVATVYSGNGAILPLVVTVPNVSSTTDPATPTGTVFNGSTGDFLIGENQPAHFLFCTQEGTIAGWNAGTSAVTMVNNAGRAVYLGLTIGQRGGANFLYATNFETRAIDVFDKDFKPVDLGSKAFRDPRIPAKFAPFNVQSIGHSIYVTYAQREPDDAEEVTGPGRGFVDVFTTDGVLWKRLQWGAWLNAPWGVALAPADFGAFSGMILVGQFGSGKIAAFDPVSGEFRGLMRTERGRPLRIEGLWALSFGNGTGAGSANTLYFAAGIDDEADGLFGTLTPAAEKGHHGRDK